MMLTLTLMLTVITIMKDGVEGDDDIEYVDVDNDDKGVDVDNDDQGEY